MRVLLISTYDLGHQPFGLASPAAWLRRAGAEVACLDLAVQPLDAGLVAAAGLVALYLPMHTATRLATALIPQLRALNPRAHLCCYGLYAPANEGYLRGLGVRTVLGGEFEPALVALYARLATESPESTNRSDVSSQPAGPSVDSVAHIEPRVGLEKLEFLTPDRAGLPGLDAYSFLRLPDGSARLAGYTEATRGCRHRCRHCPIVPVYDGQLRVVQPAVVLEDIRRQVAAGARHITFGDPDFFNGPGHAIPLVRALHREIPDLTYDVTIKVEHLLRHARHLPALRDTGCVFVTSAVEAVDDAILERFAKRHTRADFARAVALLRSADLALNPTFVAFTPWTTRAGYLDLLRTIADLDMVEHVAPIQYALRLLIPAGSRLLELPEARALVGPFDDAALCYPWAHPDPLMDQLQAEVMATVRRGQARRLSRQDAFAQIWALAAAAQETAARGPALELRPTRARAPAPQMSEPWYC